MARDYAQRKSNARAGSNARRKPAPRSQGLPPGVTLFLGLTIGLVLAAAVYIKYKPLEHGLTEQEPQKKSAQIPKPEKPDGRFTFYDMLENYEVVVESDRADTTRPNTPNKPAPQPAKPNETTATQPTESYVIQAGSFTTNAEADRRKANLALLGIESRIERGDAPGGQSRYRVRIGPVTNLSRVNEIMGNLRANGIDALLMRKKG